MLVVLPSKQVSEHWDMYKELIRLCIPITKDMIPDFMTNMLYSAMTGRIQCWMGFDEGNDLYLSMITKKVVDDLTGQKSLLVYALATYKQPSRELRMADFETFRKIAKSMGCPRFSAYTGSQAVAQSMLKATKGGELVYYVLVPTEEV